MKLIEVIVLIVMIPLNAKMISGNVRSFFELNRKIMKEKKVLDRDRFISESFRKVCEKNEKSDVQESEIKKWKEMCLSMWTLDSISIKTKGIKDNEKLLCAVWKKGDDEKSVFHVVKCK